jgi:hypothetical protein
MLDVWRIGGMAFNGELVVISGCAYFSAGGFYSLGRTAKPAIEINGVNYGAQACDCGWHSRYSG